MMGVITTMPCLEHRVDCEYRPVYTINTSSAHSLAGAYVCLVAPHAVRRGRQMHARVEFGVWRVEMDESEERVPAASKRLSP